MARTLQIIDWEKHYETSETRKLKELRWVPVRNNLNDPGYVRLVGRENGTAMFGTWIALLQLASRCKKRGTFEEGDGSPYDIETLAAVLRVPMELCRQTVAMLTTQPKWLEWVGDPSDEPPADYPGTSAEPTVRIESNGREKKADHVDVDVSRRNRISANTEKGARDAKRIANVLGPKNGQDRTLVLKAALLAQSGMVSEGVVWDALEGVKQTKGIRNRVGYFLTCLKEKAAAQGKDALAIMDGMEIPREMLAEFNRPPDKRLCEVGDD